MNRRQHPRLEINHPAVVNFGGRSYAGWHVQNFSQGGLFLQQGDPGFGEQMGQGFHPQSQRQQAMVELVGSQFSLPVEIVFVNQTGLGVSFLTPEAEVFDYLKDFRREKGALTELPVEEIQKPEPATRAIIERLSSKTLEYLKKSLSRFQIVAREDLISSTGENNRPDDQSDLFFTVTTLEKEEARLTDTFISGVEHAISGLLDGESATQVEEKSPEMTPKLELKLVEKDHFDELMFLNSIAHRTDTQLAEPIHAINLALSHLVRKSIKGETNPISPISLLLQIKRPLDAIGISPDAKRYVFNAFSKSVFTHIHQLYREINACLIEEGVAVGSDQSTAEQTRHEPTGIQLSEPSRAIGTLENLSALLPQGGERVTGRDSPSDYPVAPRERVMESINAIPPKTAQSLIRHLETYLSQTGDAPVSLDQSTRAVIGASEELVGAVQQDDMLCGSVQQLVGRLEVPFIKEALNDPTLLENTEHPGRRFLAAVEGLAPYCSNMVRGDSGGMRFDLGLEQLVADIESGAVADIQQATDQIEGLQDRQKEQFDRNRNLAIESCKRNHQLRQAHLLVRESLQEILGGKSVSIAIDRLFQYGWANLLIHTAVLHGQTSKEWRAYLRVPEFLLRIFPQERDFVTLSEKNASELIKIIKKGFLDYPVYPEGTQQFLIELKKALVQGGKTAQAFVQERFRVDDAYLKQLFVGQIELETDADDVHQAGLKWLELVEKLELQEWVVERRSEGQVRLVNMAWKNPQSGRFLLVDGNGIKVIEADANELASLFETNRYALLENRELQVVDRAVQRILKNTYNTIQQEVNYDELTGLMNRRAFVQLLNELLREVLDGEHQHTLIMIDLDQFGLVNDLSGFEGGDKLLQSITNIITTYLPDNAHLARTGDDEFGILLPRSSLDQAYQLAESNRLAIDEFKYSWNNQVIPVSSSVGVVAVECPEHTAADLLKAASSACDIAKQAGRNCTRIYRANDREFMEHKKLVKSVGVIEDALTNNRLVLFGQPIVSLQDGLQRTHYEVLLRILDENDEMQSPFHFILAAEKYDLIRSVDRWVVNAFFEMVDLQRNNLQAIEGFSINLSGQSMADAEFKSFLKERIENSPIPREKLAFEITETAMVKDSSDAIAFIQEIKETGCSFYLDDFGSGYASFSYLKDLPVDYVKIDGMFIKGLLNDKPNHAMVKAVTEISHFMGKQVVAEFVEDEATASELKKIGVDFIQGYHVGRPEILQELFDDVTVSAAQM